MKILKIFGIVVGIHLAILFGVFVMPGCSSTVKPEPAPAATAAKSDQAPMITVPTSASPAAVAGPDLGASPISPAPVNFNPDAPATYADNSGGERFTPTRPNTAAASAVLQQPVTGVTPAVTYKVKGGDSLWTIAKRNHLTVSELAAANRIRPSAVLREGQNLIIPAHSASARPHAATAASNSHARAATRAPHVSGKSVTYKVKPGETLGQIAHMFGVKLRDIAVANNIADPRHLRAGTTLVIPGGGWRAPAAKSRHHAAAADTAASSSAEVPEAAQPASAPEAAPAAPAPEATPSTTPSDQGQPPAPANVPVINIDQNPVSPAPKS